MEIKAFKVLEILKDMGYKEVSIRGDHHKFKNKQGNTTSVPYRNKGDSIPIGTYKAILKQIKKNK